MAQGYFSLRITQPHAQKKKSNKSSTAGRRMTYKACNDSSTAACNCARGSKDRGMWQPKVTEIALENGRTPTCPMVTATPLWQGVLLVPSSKFSDQSAKRTHKCVRHLIGIAAWRLISSGTNQVDTSDRREGRSRQPNGE